MNQNRSVKHIREMDFPDRDRTGRKPMSNARKHRLGRTAAGGAAMLTGLGLITSGALSGPAKGPKHPVAATTTPIAPKFHEANVGNQNLPAETQTYINTIEQGQGLVEMGTVLDIPAGTPLFFSPANEANAGGGASNEYVTPKALTVQGLVVAKVSNQATNSTSWDALTTEINGQPELMFTPDNIAYHSVLTTDTQDMENSLNLTVSVSYPFIYGKGVPGEGSNGTPLAIATEQN